MSRNQEIKNLKISIQNENVILQRVKRMLQWSVMVVVVGLIFLFTFLKESSVGRTITFILVVVFGILSLFSGVSYWNGRKHLLKKMNDLDAKK